MTIYIGKGERVVGNFASDPSKLPINPELCVDYLEEGLQEQWQDMLDEKGRQKFKDIYEYWRNRCIDARVRAVLPPSLQKWVAYKTCGGVVSADEFKMDRAWPALNYEKSLRLGLRGIIREAEERLHSLESDVPVDGPQVANWMSQIHFLKASILSCEAAVKFANRFTLLAKRVGAEETDPQRKMYLEEITQNCERVPEHPALTFHQAIQSFWFIYLIAYLIESTRHGLGARLDKILYPYYQNNQVNGKLTREEAKELIEFLLLKIEECGQIALPSFHVIMSGATLHQEITIGGVDEEGKDASNEVSFIILDAVQAMRTCQTSLALRYHSKINPELVAKAVDVIGNGLSYPEIVNDDRYIKYLVDHGVPLEIARDYCIGACVAPALPGKNTTNRTSNLCVIALPRCLELALNSGKDPRTGEQIGAQTPDPFSFNSWKQVLKAYLKQVNFAVDKVVKINNVAFEIYRQYGQLPFASSLLDGCIEKGMDCTAWCEYPYHHILAAGPVNVADSLAALKKFVFEDRRISMADLLELLKGNFEGQEEWRQILLNKAPKFGNDDDYVDFIMKEVVNRTQKEVEKFKDLWGYPITLDASLAGAYYGAGRATGALPDGKREGRIDSYADGTISPGAGRDKKGPTAVVRSMSKATPSWTMIANQKFMPQLLEGANRAKFMAYLKTWADLGNWHIQFNIVDNQTLRKAQEEPESYKNLIVRVAGYSAYFVDLPLDLQNEIIARKSQCFS
jgi:formate C-acetyltransferase